MQVCGEANVGVIREAAQAGVPRCAFISVHDYNLPGKHKALCSVAAAGNRHIHALRLLAQSHPCTGFCLPIMGWEEWLPSTS